ncbi:hypothetical protein RB628_25815 [Streptomyces sp. ADMS]|uniref:hypothetical protein n=1 Tax=Streptomyces sp. ADMS TaxID=3071415 RepID=UPI00296F95E1|nr:hypothetical protein [Streptomyces sp. ADMS]MDW4908661.1 hypothetical protein [Streptomyces sp. ADMS]
MKPITHRIDGKPVESTSGRFGAIHDPATGAQEKQVASASDGGINLVLPSHS